MRVLLTGAAGFIGTAVARALSAQGHDVVAVDALIPQAHGDGRTAPPAGQHRLDVRDADAWSGLLHGVDVVCHQAAMVGAGTSVADLPLYAAHNDLGTASLLAAMTAAGVDRLVLASSMVVYGEGRYACERHGLQAPAARSRAALEAGDFECGCPRCGAAMTWQTVPEHARLDPRSSYAASKLAQEHYAAAWTRQAEASAVALRYHNVYGPGMPRDTPYSGVAAIFRSALERGSPPRVFEDGGQMRDFVHVDDVARANVLAVELVAGSTALPGAFAPYNVCSGVPVSIREVADHVAAGSGGEGGSLPPLPPLPPVVTGEFRPGDVRHVVASADLAERELGFRAAVAPTEGLARFATDPLR